MNTNTKATTTVEFDDSITDEMESPVRSIYRSVMPPQWIENKLEELSSSKADKETLIIEINHLKDRLHEYKLEAYQEHDDFKCKVNDLSSEINCTTKSITGIYKWFAGIMITVILSFVGASTFFMKAASDISNQVSLNSEHVVAIEKAINKIEDKIESDNEKMISKVVKETIRNLKDPT